MTWDSEPDVDADAAVEDDAERFIDEPTPPHLDQTSVDEIEQPPPPIPLVFDRQPLASNVKWVWTAGWVIPAVFALSAAFGLTMFVFDVSPTIAVIATVVVMSILAWLTTRSRYRNWSWMLDETELIIDRGIVFKLTRVIPRVRVLHVDISSGPMDRLLGLRQISIYTAGTREADAKIPGLAERTAEELRQALIHH